ncbi:hypothetical protein H9Y05_01865 [Crocinitomicaceae bacterium CZZ-1]|uniref:Lipoprotein n=1 Tax=Taishania pollutisoli TaxID=2766479 RepID=A0A8J6PDB6_9FLAO|nr:hypothetical protein [Taishania pollutisoli]MBC9811210.1 hypothetical protein [Taishania pollutisoli]
MGKIIVIGIAVLGLIGCKSIAMKMNGMTKPQLENAQTIREKAHAFGMDTTNIVSVHSRDFVHELKRAGIPDALIYDRNGNYIEYRATDTSCNAGLFQFIPDLKLNTTYNQPDSISLSEIWTKYRDLNGNVLKAVEPSDFYVLIYWTTWSGKLNKDHVKVWEDLAKVNTNCSIKVIKVNLDLQDHWEEGDKEKLVEAMTGKKKK